MARTRGLIVVLSAVVGTLLMGAVPRTGREIVVQEGLDTLKDAVAQASPGDTLLLKPGLYELSSTVLIDKDLTIRGSTSDPKNVHIVATEEFDFQPDVFQDPLDWGHLLFVTSGAATVSFSYFTIKGAPEVEAIDELTCEGVFGLNHSECFGDGIHADGAAVVRIERVHASLNAGNGIYVDGAQRAEFIGVVGVNNGAFGIDVDTALDLSIRQSTFMANQISGVEASGHVAGTQRADYVADVRIEDTLANGNGEIGIEVERFETATLRRVTCADNREDGFDADRVSVVKIRDSSFVNNLDDGMELFPVGVPPEEQPGDFPGSIIESFDHLVFAGNVGEDVNHPPTEN